MADDKNLHDIWQKCCILLKDKDVTDEDESMLRILKLAILDQTFARDESFCVSNEEIYRKIYDEYCSTFKKNISSIKFFNEQLKDVDFKINFDPPKSLRSNVNRTKEEKVITIDYENIDKDQDNTTKYKDFKMASEKLIENKKRNFASRDNPTVNRKTLRSRKFVSPLTTADATVDQVKPVEQASTNDDTPDIKGIDKKLVELILNDIIDKGSPITWNDIAGLEFAKKTIEEIIIWPMVRPDLFTGLLIPVKGLLLFGPPGTGKTLIGKCIANQCNAKFFSISASSLTSKWFGEGEKLVRALFEVAKHFQPSVVFMDEVDSLLTARKDSEHESTRRIKTEFLVQLDGCGSSLDDRILIIGATNRPQELDDAARRRFVKRLYVPLPDQKARKQIIYNLISNQSHDLDGLQIEKIVDLTNGYSGADMMNLCKDAALGPIRDLTDIANASVTDFRPMNMNDFSRALRSIKPSVGPNDIHQYINWNNQFGSCSGID